MSALSWEDMARQVLVAGRPTDITSAALGWQALLGNIDEVKRLVDADVHDLGESWKGPAYDSFRTHMEGLTKQAEIIVDGARESGGGQHSIVTVLQTAAQDLERAQNAMPVPQGCVGDLAAARNGAIVIETGLFEASIRADFVGSWPMEKLGQLNDWVGEFFNNNTEDARRAYDQVSSDYAARERETPGGALLERYTDGGPSGVDLEGPPGTGAAGSAADLGGGPSTGGELFLGAGHLSSGGAGFGSGTHPDLSSGTGGYDGTTPTGSGASSGVGNDVGDGALAGEYSSGLAGAGAGTGTLTGGNSGFGAGGSLPSATGLGAGGGGLGGTAGLGGAGGPIPGGGSLGRPVSLGMPPMMGGAAGTGGAGRGANRPSSRGGAAMAPGMVGAGGRGGSGSSGPRAGGGGVRGGLTGANSGAGDGNEESQHGTWLREDDDVWGADDDGTDGVLR
ncbi:WXG100 family type VII secretion target [Micromonospora violae]|uniref:WXG100 family type VII secretion target n=1 Tax=Micromonospora violae TaxID=1278207 RepID=UPI0034055EDE